MAVHRSALSVTGSDLYMGSGMKPWLSSQNVFSLEVGKNVKCHAIIYPTWSYARQNIVWSSSDASVATITPDGFLTGINKGDCVITASTPDGVITKGYYVYVERSMTPVAVDLGLPSGTKWAAFNLFATSPEEYGSYFAWGDTSPNNSRFIWDT